jgi:Ni/Co efflux regulator RcnB
MKMSLLAAATALMLIGTAGTASAKHGNGGGHKGEAQSKGHSDGRNHSDGRSDGRNHSNGHSVARNHVYRDCDGIVRGHHDNRNKKGKDCDGIHNRFDDRDVLVHNARRSFEGPRYIAPRDYRYVRYDSGARLPQGYYGSVYYVDYQPYGLAPPPQGYRWNRVGNDVYLVSIRDGLIAQAVYSLFR